MPSVLAPAASGLTTCQQSALEKLQRQGNIFLTGAAGTGKSYLLNQYLANKGSLEFPVVASTGAAAVIIGGRTFHSFFGLGIMEGGLDATIARALRNRKLHQRLNAAACVVIDEISMLPGGTLYAADCIARRIRGVNEPWGGLRVIVVGDFAQLPPVSVGSGFLSGDSFEKDWAFLHPVWQQSDFQPALLSTVMRTQDTAFLSILNYVRAGIVNDEVTAFLDKHMVPQPDHAEGTRLYAHRAKAEDFNLRRLESLPGRVHSFATNYAGDERYLDTGKRAMPIPEELHIKTGALVMMRKNDISGERLYVNGSLGHVRSINEETLTISLFTGEDIDIEREQFTYLNGDGEELLTADNFPITLAWATTIHKAQGASLDRVTVDLSALWEPGQAYVALSRVRSAEGLTIERWNPKGIRAEQLVTDLYDSLSIASGSYVPRPIFTVESQDVPEESHEKKSDHKGVRETRAELIRELLSQECSLEEITDACGIKTDRVLLALEQMLEEGTELPLAYLLADVPEAARIRELFEEHGPARLKPVYEALGEEVPFTTIRLVRCVMMGEGE